MTITISANVKAAQGNTSECYPNLYGYLFGKQGKPKRINTYMATGAIKSTDWLRVTVTYQLPEYTNSMRLFMNKFSVKNKNDLNVAFFDKLSVKLGIMTKKKAGLNAISKYAKKIRKKIDKSPKSIKDNPFLNTEIIKAGTDSKEEVTGKQVDISIDEINNTFKEEGSKLNNYYSFRATNGNIFKKKKIGEAVYIPNKKGN